MKELLKNRLFMLIILPFAIGVMLAVNGCTWIKKVTGRENSSSKQTPVQIEIDPNRLIGDYALAPRITQKRVHGTGLVVNLNGTGSTESPGPELNVVLQGLRNNPNIENPTALVASKDTALVRIQAMVPFGAQEGDHLDLEVFIPPGSEASSIRNGILLSTSLQELFDGGDGTPRKGHTIVRGQGPIFLGDSSESKAGSIEQLQGRILGGGRVLKSQPIHLTLSDQHKAVFYTTRMADAINKRFYFPERNRGAATAKTDQMVELELYPRYRHNISRYIKVVRSIAMFEDAQSQSERIARLEKELLDPEKSESASFQLEAIGRKGIEPLKAGLKSKNTEVRFYSAVALAYLNCGDAAETLADLAKNEPDFRAYALEALGAMENDYDADTKLGELLHVESVETRYGAFYSLLQLNPYDTKIRGELVNNQFHYHVIDSRAYPIIHIKYSKRPEIVLFGQDIPMPYGFVLGAGPRIVVKGDRPGFITVTRINMDVNETRTVPARLDDTLMAIANLGGSYQDIVRFLRDASAQNILPCRLEIDKLPSPARIHARAYENEEPEEEQPKKKSVWSKLNPANMFNKNTPDDSEIEKIEEESVWD